MPTPPKGPRLGGSPAHDRLILANLATSLFEHGKITTTVAKAKRLRPYAEKLITTAKRNTLHARREVLKSLRDKDVVHRLFAEIGPSFATREGGYTRIVKTGPRRGDNAPMAVIELVGEETVSSAASRVARRATSQRAGDRAARVAASTAAAASTAPTPTDATEQESAESAAAEAPDSTTDADAVGAEVPGEDGADRDGASAQVVAAAAESSAEGADTDAASEGDAPDSSESGGAPTGS